jgi:hypothetical protein
MFGSLTYFTVEDDVCTKMAHSHNHCCENAFFIVVGKGMTFR